MQLAQRERGFTLAEVAIAFVIVSLILGSALVAFQSVVDQRNTDEAQRRLNAAVDSIIGFALVNKRLPCPAVAGATGVEAAAANNVCTSPFGGFLPATDIGYAPTDASGYAVDPWGARIRYAVAGSVALTGTGCPNNFPAGLTNQANLKANGLACRPGPTDLDICTTSTGVSANSCNTAMRAAAQSSIAFIVWSTGKNGLDVGSYGPDEIENATTVNNVFIYRTPSSSTSAQGQYDDLMVYMPIGVLYQKLIAAGVLP